MPPVVSNCTGSERAGRVLCCAEQNLRKLRDVACELLRGARALLPAVHFAVESALYSAASPAGRPSAWDSNLKFKRAAYVLLSWYHRLCP
ncbi:hypothetical protein NDU88_009845 [Pleurodeles waltl]|uniref:Uncharacterized protein n=1 Tax=Pleurodeles waltl TaxID=8319 RepID=A0AAV7S1K5_PLEWA|nr:hypothetical protein NDU88_009845 [Pleurodeles waltl]